MGSGGPQGTGRTNAGGHRKRRAPRRAPRVVHGGGPYGGGSTPSPRRRRQTSRTIARTPTRAPRKPRAPVSSHTKEHVAQTRIQRRKPKVHRKKMRIVPTAGGSARVLPEARARKLLAQGRRNAVARQQESARIGGFPRAKRAAPGWKDKHIGPVNVTAELEGRGGLSGASKFLKKQIDTGVTGKLARRSLSASTGMPDKMAVAALKDAVDLPATTVASTYNLAAGVKEAAQGRPQRIKKLGKQLAHHDPVALTVQGKFKQAAKEASKHPLVTALEVSGVGRGASRLAGKTVKAKTVERSAPGTLIRPKAKEHPGLIERKHRARTRHQQIAKARQGHAAAEAAMHEGASTEEVAQMRRAAVEADPRLVPAHEIHRRVDQRMALAESRRRTGAPNVKGVPPGRAHVMRQADEALKHEPEASLLTAQAMIRPTRASAKAYSKVISDNAPHAPARKYANARTRKAVKKAEGAKMEQAIEGAAKYKAAAEPLQKDLVRRGMLEPERERMAKLIPYARLHMGAEWEKKSKDFPKGGLVLRDPEGATTHLKAPAIEAHMKANGVKPPAFVTHDPSKQGPGAYFISSNSLKSVGAKTRTGNATMQGTMELSKEGGRRSLVRMQQLASHQHEYGGFVDEFGLRKPDGEIHTFKNAREAQEHADNLSAMPAEHNGELTPAAYDWQPVPLRPKFGPKGQAESLLHEANHRHDQTMRDATDEALQGKGEGDYTLVLQHAAERQREHLRALGGPVAGKALRQVVQQFKRTVLPVSTKWLMGNVTEATLRSAINRAGPLDRKFAQDVIAEIRKKDPAAADELFHRVGEGHYGMQGKQEIHTVAKEFQNSRLRKPVNVLAAIRRTPIVKEGADAWVNATNKIFGANGAVERQFKLAMLGQHAQKMHVSGHVLGNWHKAVEEAANGLTGTDAQVAAAQAVRRAYGQYEAFGPSERLIIAQYTPFIAWTRNAVQFLAQVLPQDHPVLTGLLAANYLANEDWRKKEGLGLFAAAHAPGFMQGIPGKHRSYPVQRYTPFGVSTDILGTAESAFAPEITAPLKTFAGLDWNNQPLAGKDNIDKVTMGEKLGGFGKALGGALVPGVGPVTQALGRKGDTPGSKLNKQFNPLAGYKRQDPKISKAYAELDKIKTAKDKYKGKTYRGKKITAANAPPSYQKLHRRERKLKETLGHHYKRPYRPNGGGGKTGGSHPDEGVFPRGGGGSHGGGGGGSRDPDAGVF